MPREHAWDWIINGKGYMALRDESGAPVYRTEAIPVIAREAYSIAEEQRDYASLHGGFGHSRFLLPSTYDYGDCIDTTRPRRIVCPPLITSMTAAASVTGGFGELGSTLWVGAGRYLQSINTTNDTIATPDGVDYTKGKDFGVGAVISSLIQWESLLDVWFSSSTNGFTFNGSTAPTELSGKSVKRVYSSECYSENAAEMVQVGSLTNGAGYPCVAWLPRGGTIDSALGSGWSAAYNVGDKSQTITGVSSGKKMAWIAKKDGLYYIDGTSGRSMRVFKPQPINDNNGVGLFTDEAGRVWYPSLGGLIRYNPLNGVLEDVTPGRGLSHDSTIYGRPTAVTQYKGWYFASMYNGTNSYVMQGRDREDGEPGTGAVVWHGAIAKLSGQITHLLAYGQTTPPRLYMAAGTTVAYIRIDAPYRYAATGKVYFPADNMGALSARFNLAGFVVACTGFNRSTYADVYAKIDHGDWQLVNRLQASGRVFIPIPSGDWRFTEMAFYFDITNASSTATPEIWGVTMLGTRRVYTRAIVQTSLICSERVLNLMDHKPRRSGADMVNELDGLAIQRPVSAVDYLTGERRERTVLVQPIRTRLVRFGEKGKWEEWGEVVDLAMVCQSSAAVQVDDAPSQPLWGGFAWGDGTRWA